MQLQAIQKRIYEIRRQKVMLDFDLSELYQVETRALKQAVKRNLFKFPNDFMFELTKEEINQMVSQNVIPSKSHLGGAIPMAFTEQRVAMLSTVLKSKKAIEVNIGIIRAFVIIRQYSLTYKELSDRLKEIEGKFTDVYQAINYLLNKDKQEVQQKQRNRIGFKTNNGD
ncbi:MAG: ORF6N domain-containing protein [Saprospiraceae bacterium]|nr:ORF6N domain-containing protein [Saprospiraceae bacterium]